MTRWSGEERSLRWSPSSGVPWEFAATTHTWSSIISLTGDDEAPSYRTRLIGNASSRGFQMRLRNGLDAHSRRADELAHDQRRPARVGLPSEELSIRLLHAPHVLG